jgi:short-subunit dehydrogenase
MALKVIVITGSSSGIGKALAKVYASSDNALVLGARNLENLKLLANSLQSKCSNIYCISIDVSKEKDCKKLIESAIERFGRIDIIINNAGISMRAIFEEVDVNVLKSLMDVNFWGMVYCTKFALPYLLESKGSVVGVSSIAGYKGLPGRTGYSASKFAMHGFLECLRIENIKKDLHVLLACPGFTASNIRNTALGKDGQKQKESPRDESKMMSAEQVANHIKNAVEKRKRTLTLTGQGKITVLLNKFFPKLVDKLVYNHMAKEPDSPFK